MEFTTPIAWLTFTNTGGEYLAEVESELESIQTALRPLTEARYLDVPNALVQCKQFGCF